MLERDKFYEFTHWSDNDIEKREALEMLSRNSILRKARKMLSRIIILNEYGGMEMRTRITLACTECKNRNYDTTKDKKAHPDRMETKKYCRFCKRHTMHKETK